MASVFRPIVTLLCLLVVSDISFALSYGPSGIHVVRRERYGQVRTSRSLTIRAANATKAPTTCDLKQDFIERSVKTNCRLYIDPLETSRWAVLPWERWQVANQFSNCTYHQLFTQYPDAPSGFSAVMWEDGKPVMRPRPLAESAKNYGPGEPIRVSFEVGDEPSVDFLPIFEDATAPFFVNFCQVYDAQFNSSMGTLYESINIATHQYTRCSYQKPFGDVATCTIETTKKLQYLPPAMFIYSGSHECNSKTWSFVGVGLSILIEFIHTAVKMWLSKTYATSGFSWLMLLVRLVSGLGEPIVSTIVLQRSSFDSTSAFLIGAMEMLQPTAAPLIAGVAGWHISKGEGFQVLTTDAVITLLGLFLAAPHVALTNSTIASNSGYNLGLVPLGLILAIGPWALAYGIGGIFSLAFQFCFILAIIFRSDKLAEFASINLVILIGLIAFVALTPIWALWELIWKLVHTRRQKKLEWQAAKEDKERELKNVFPLARYFKVKFQTTSSWKRGLAIFVFWFFILLSFVSFVGKWMVMVNLLGAAGDAYCPSHFAEATFAGLGVKVGVLAIGVALQYFGLTA